MSSQGFRGADPDGLIALTQLLDALADALDRVTAQLRLVIDGVTIVPAVDRIAEVAEWVRRGATVARRVALTVLSDGADWRAHHDLFDNVIGVGDAFAHGVVQGFEGIVRGVGALAQTSTANLWSAGQAIWDAQNDDWDSVERDLSEVDAREVAHAKAFWHSGVVAIAETEPAMFSLHAHQDGFWRAARDSAFAWGEQTPSLIVAAATAGAGAGAGVAGEAAGAAEAVSAAGLSDAAVSVAKQVTNAGYVDPRGVASGQRAVEVADVPAVALSVPVNGGGDHFVGLDPKTGDFLVTRSGDDGTVTVGEKRWSRLSDKERQALQDNGVVDRHGHFAAA